MDIQECFDLMRSIRKAQKDIKTPIGKCKSLQDHMDSKCQNSERQGIVSLGEPLEDGRYVLYASFNGRDVPNEWHGFPVINVEKE